MSRQSVIMRNESGTERIGVDPPREDGLIPIWIENDDNYESTMIHLSKGAVEDLISALQDAIEVVQ